MLASMNYLLTAISTLAIVAVFVFLLNPARKSVMLSPLSALSFGLVIIGVFIGEDSWLGYGMMGAGVLMAIVDLIFKFRDIKTIE